ncbi:HK97 family phage prohead protease [Tuanshanicoccus lijuaniae]|uniref:HK97 family phage prohead protease n=1 Tax=Aerococcaceae bacterium zg-1292 TaxID=2774330 RepID=UPI001935D19E|nr:HK97 family phage prohead protease [Aerococcaceae bacterium zg-1292]MBS4456319.1 HK97 family phage prohead protease [Aerococcaceae bacterium zg-A91]MBS4458094.1 HK97 family phage prohead protease [Aerococcaceae bacterium zg-BR33]MBS4458748.1 HK97 family phage prohead protease [Aerococcaceae bacterium zg-BR33]QQA37528.1 HK97 family phage prohead protease [Aerococcaceae bacterium zg-1292]
MKEIRTATIQTNDDELVLVGTPILYDTPTEINDPRGSYTEVIKRGALDGAELSDTRLLYNHDLNKVPLARTPRTLQLSLSSVGLEMTATLPNTEEAKSVYTAVKRGDLTGMSFAFKVPQNGDSYDRATNTRTIHKIEKVYEISVVPFPAYPETSVEARSAMQHSRALSDLLIKLNQLELKEI